ncbi:hypothetical protein LINPERHAP1_LOCUS2780 [Linum perenne]
MGGPSKDLLKLEKENSEDFESSLLVCGKNSSASQSKGGGSASSGEKLVTAPIPQSQVLGKVRDFLGAFSEANRQLEKDAKDNSNKYDIEALTGNESEVIEMDLMLGVAELRNQQALAAAEAALAGAQPLARLDGGGSSESDSEDDSSDDEEDESDGENGNDGSSKVVDKRRPKKQPKIIEIP